MSKIRRNLEFYFVMIISFFIGCFAFAHGSVSTVKCEGVNGLQIVEDFKPDGTAFTRMMLTDLYTSQSDDSYITHLTVDKSRFDQGNVKVDIEILNNKKQTIKKYTAEKWVLYPNFIDKKVTKINISKILSTLLTEPYDRYANLDSKSKKIVDPQKVPYDARISLISEDRAFCTFDFSYGSVVKY